MLQACFTDGVEIGHLEWCTNESWELYHHWLYTREPLTAMEFLLRSTPPPHNVCALDQEQKIRTDYLDLFFCYTFGQTLQDYVYTDCIMSRLIDMIRSPHAPTVLMTLLTESTATLHAIMQIKPVGCALHYFLVDAIAWFGSDREVGVIAFGEYDQAFKSYLMIALAKWRRVMPSAKLPGRFGLLNECGYHDHRDKPCYARRW